MGSMVMSRSSFLLFITLSWIGSLSCPQRTSFSMVVLSTFVSLIWVMISPILSSDLLAVAGELLKILVMRQPFFSAECLSPR